MNKSRAGEIIDGFRAHVDDIQRMYGADVSVIAHSFGSYISTSYLLGYDIPPVSFDTLILTGSIIDENIDIEKFRGRCYRIINETAPNDDVVKLAKVASLGKDPPNR